MRSARNVIATALLVMLVSLTLARPASASPLPVCTAGYHAAYVDQTPSGTIVASPGQVVSVTIRLQNVGCNSWTWNTGSEARLGTQNPQPGYNMASDLCPGPFTNSWKGTTGCDRIAQNSSPSTVLYGQIASFSFNIRSPYVNNMYPEGIFTVYLQPVIDGVAWMENFGIYTQLKVGNYYGVKNTSFKRPSITPPQTVNLMDQQSTCLYCVPAATTAWISYVWQNINGTDSGHYFTHQDFWDNYFGPARHTYSAYNTLTAVNCGYTYTRRGINASQDDGVDPYGAAWGIFDYTPGGQYYHVNTYRDSVSGGATGYDYATRGIGLALSRFDEPVGVLVGNGGHYVLATGVISNVDPNVNFWGAAITKVYVRDPWVVPAQQLQAFATGLPSAWSNTFNKYGYNNGVPRNPPVCPNCVDEAHGFGGAPPVWWGANVTVERNPKTGVSDTPDLLKRYGP